MKKIMIPALALSLLTTSCATMLTGSYQKVTIASNVSDAIVKVNTVEVGKTNQEVKVYRRDMDGVLQVSKEGCVTKDILFPHKTNAAIYLDLPTILFTGLLFSYVDVALGNNISAKTKTIQVDLDCPKPAPLPVPVAPAPTPAVKAEPKQVKTIKK